MLEKQVLPTRLVGIDEDTCQVTLVESYVILEDGVELSRHENYVYAPFDDAKLSALLTDNKAGIAYVNALSVKHQDKLLAMKPVLVAAEAEVKQEIIGV